MIGTFFFIWFLSGWRILLFKSHLPHVHNKISKTKPHEMAAIRAENFGTKLELNWDYSE